MLRRTLGEDIAVKTALGDGLWPALADPSQLEDAILNLAVNARDAMPNGGRLVIETANVHLDEQYAAQNVEVTPGDYVLGRRSPIPAPACRPRWWSGCSSRSSPPRRSAAAPGWA